MDEKQSITKNHLIAAIAAILRDKDDRAIQVAVRDAQKLFAEELRWLEENKLPGQ
jgi:hypothetical protein